MGPVLLLLQEFINQPGGLQFVELSYADPKQLLGQLLDVLFIEAVFVDDLQDQLLLLGRALPVLVLLVSEVLESIPGSMLAVAVAVAVVQSVLVAEM